jgi:DNA end-binding protein Ku
VRDEAPYFEDIPDVKLPAEMRELASHIVEKKSGHFDPSKFEDRYENAVIELVKSKQTGKPVELPKAPQPSNVINLMDALRKSIGSERITERPKAESKPSARRKPASAAKKAAPAKKRNLKKAS